MGMGMGTSSWLLAPVICNISARKVGNFGWLPLISGSLLQIWILIRPSAKGEGIFIAAPPVLWCLPDAISISNHSHITRLHGLHAEIGANTKKEVGGREFFTAHSFPLHFPPPDAFFWLKQKLIWVGLLLIVCVCDFSPCGQFEEFPTLSSTLYYQSSITQISIFPRRNQFD